jgi:4-amino-4-deoxy-L-arabinose transferase-like glycosyltransferase
MSRRFQVTWFLVALVFGLALNEANLRFIRRANPTNLPINGASTIQGAVIWSPDSTYYLPPIKNILAGHGYTIDPAQPDSRTRRTPGYPLFYGLHYVLFGEEGSFRVLRWTQLLLNAVAPVLLGWTVLWLGGQAALARASVVLYALSPFTTVYSFYTMTESLYPFLTVATLACFARGVQRRSGALLFAAGLGVAAVVLTRPVVGLLLPTLLLALWWIPAGGRGLAVRSGLLLTAGFALGMLPWVARNHAVTGGRFVPLEGGNTIGFGPGFEAFRGWWSAWQPPGNLPIDHAKRVHAALEAGRDDLVRAEIDSLMSSLPASAFAGSSPVQVRTALVALAECWRERLRLAAPGEYAFQRVGALPCDAEVAVHFRTAEARFRAADPLRYFLLTPAKLTAQLVFHSHSSNFAPLNPPGRRFAPWQVALKAGLYALNVLLFAAFLYAGLSPRLPAPLKCLILVFPAATVLFLALGLRTGIEARYLLPAHPFFHIALAALLLDVRGGTARRAAARGPASAQAMVS